jgi:hypothetical protein
MAILGEDVDCGGYESSFWDVGSVLYHKIVI